MGTPSIMKHANALLGVSINVPTSSDVDGIGKTLCALPVSALLNSVRYSEVSPVFLVVSHVGDCL